MKKSRRGIKNALSLGDPLEWERQFRARCEGEELAIQALHRLEEVGLGDACRRLLWEYSRGQGCFEHIQHGVGLIVANLEAYDRAERVWKSKSNDRRAQLFRQRFDGAARVLMETPWPFHNPAIRTFGDLFRLTCSEDLFNLRKVRALVGRSKLSFMLVMLRVGAEAHAVSLSGNELAALAYCASGRGLDSGAVRRILREPWVAAAEPWYRTVFENCYCRACR